MTTDEDRFAWLDRYAPRGSILRFGLAGGFNSLVFFMMWEALMLIFTAIDVRWLWGLSWGATGIMAHFVHRAFTFDKRRPLKVTLPTSVPVYVGSLVGSSLTIGWMAEQAPDWLRFLGVVNTLVWGLLIWATMRVVVFRFTSSNVHNA